MLQIRLPSRDQMGFLKLSWLWGSTVPARPRPSANSLKLCALKARPCCWGQRTGTEVIRTKAGGDPAAVLFDALEAANARHTDCVIIDTAGRLHTKSNLMAELEKMRRTAQRLIPGAPHEVLLVIDATTGQNGLQQAKQFTDAAAATGVVLTKLDGTAKGGVVVAIARELGLPVRYVGVGEKAGDLLPFDPKEFVDSLFA